MNFIRYVILFFAFHDSTKSNDLSVNYNIVKSILDFFQCPSVIFIFNNNNIWNSLDLLKFFDLQKQLSNNFYFSSSLLTSNGSNTLKGHFQNRMEMAVVLEAEDTLFRFLEKLSDEMDISTYKWLITSSHAPKSLKKLKIPLSSEFIFAQGNNSGGYSLSEIYDTQPEKKITKSLGRWDLNGSSQITASKDLFTRRRNLEDPCVKNSFGEGVAPIVECIHKTIWDALAEMLNATTEVLLMPHLDRDSIQKVDAEISFRSAPLDPFDLNTRWYLWPLFRSKVEIVTSLMPQQVEWRTFILPFSREMWIIIIFWLILCDLIMTGVEFAFQWKKHEMNFWQCYKEWSFTASFIFFNQEVLVPSKFTTIRIILIMMFIVTGVLFPGYSACLTSFVTVNLKKLPFRNLEELSRMKEYKLGWHKSFPLDNMFNLKDKSPLDEALLQNNVLPQAEMPETDIEAVDKMCNEKFALLTSAETILALKPKCGHYKLKQHFRTVFTSMEMKKRSWYFYFLNRCERTLEFTGTGFRLKLQAVMEYIRYKEQQIDIENNVSPIAIENIVLPFAVLLLGIIFSLFLLALEVKCYNSISKRKAQFRKLLRLRGRIKGRQGYWT